MLKSHERSIQNDVRAWQSISHRCFSLLHTIGLPRTVKNLIPLIIIITIIITSIFLLFMHQLEEHVTYLVCEVELKKTQKNSLRLVAAETSKFNFCGPRCPLSLTESNYIVCDFCRSLPELPGLCI